MIKKIVSQGLANCRACQSVVMVRLKLELPEFGDNSFEELG